MTTRRNSDFSSEPLCPVCRCGNRDRATFVPHQAAAFVGDMSRDIAASSAASSTPSLFVSSVRAQQRAQAEASAVAASTTGTISGSVSATIVPRMGRVHGTTGEPQHMTGWPSAS